MGTRQNTVKIGTLTLLEPQKFRKSYETASWYTDVEVPPGDYPLYGAFHYNESPEHPKGYQVGEDIDIDHAYARLPGVVASSYFISRLLGYHGEPQIDRDKGQPSEYQMHIYGYSLASVLAEHGGELLQGKARVRLDPEFVVQPTYTGHHKHWNEATGSYDLEVPYQAYGIFHAEAPNRNEAPAL